MMRELVASVSMAWLAVACAGSPEAYRVERADAPVAVDAASARRVAVRQVPSSVWFDEGRATLNDVGRTQVRALAEELRGRRVEIVPMDAAWFPASGKLAGQRTLASDRGQHVAGFLVETCGVSAGDVQVHEVRATPAAADGTRQPGIWIEVRVVER